MKPDRSVIDTIKRVHPEQTPEMAECVAQHVGVENVEVVLEPSGTYGDALRGYLAGLGFALYRVSPKRVHDAAEVYDGVPSLHDAKSAYLIGRGHLDGASARWEELSASRRDHHALSAQLDLYQGQHQANFNRLEAYLNRHWPEVGETTSLVLATTQGTPLEYAKAHSYLKGLGLNLKERSSGKYVGQLKITKRGPGKARKYLYFAALRCSQQDPVLKAW